IPKIVINHGTPWIPERFTKYVKGLPEEKRLEAGKDFCVREMKKIIGDNTMVVNAEQAAKDWGWGTPIIHGMYGNPLEEYFDLPKEMIVTLFMSPAGWDYYYNRRVANDIFSMLDDNGIKMEQPRSNITISGFQKYREYVGKVLIGVFPMRTSPMPRARTEFMLSGGCAISGNNYDIGKYFTGLEFKKTEVGQFITTEAGELIPENLEEAEILYADIENAKDFFAKIMYLYRNPDIAMQIGQRGKLKAQEHFTQERYQADWHKLLTKVGVL
ncbi:hypothetical protein LCGC14_0418240, partial [marine sediment metagenome]